MKQECIYVEDTPRGYYCCLAQKECLNPCAERCDEPEWDYLMKLAEEYEEGDTGAI